jgi:hypothetical protein
MERNVPRSSVKKFIRGMKGFEGPSAYCEYDALYDLAGKLVMLTNRTRGEVIPPHTQTFRRLADNNRGNKFKAA